MAGEIVNGAAPAKGIAPVTKFSVSCSVCLEAVTEDAGERSIAKLKCGHHFHLDCIGSAFNAKGRMQCPNCRQVESGNWLYASGCFVHEDFVDDFPFEEEVEAYGNLHFSAAPWCPHQGSFAQFSLTFEELDNFSHGYVDLRQGSRVSASVGQICPYLAAQGLSLGGPSPHADDFLGLHIGQHPRSSRNMRRAASFHSTQRNYGQQQASATSSSMPTAYEGPSQSYTPVGGFLQPNGNRQHTLGFLVGSPQSIHAGVSQGTSMSSGQIFGQLPLIRNTQGINSNAHPHSHSVNSSRNGFVSSRRTRQNEIPSTPQRASQGTASEVGWTPTEPVHDYTPLVASTTIGQTSSPLVGGDTVGWAAAADSQVDPWTTGMYVPQPSIGGSSHWWAWVPPGSSHGQRLVANTAPNSYHHEGQFFGTGLFPRPRAAPVAGFSEQPAEGSYTWGYSGF